MKSTGIVRKTQEDRDRLTAWYEVRRKILNGGRAA